MSGSASLHIYNVEAKGAQHKSMKKSEKKKKIFHFFISDLQFVASTVPTPSYCLPVPLNENSKSAQKPANPLQKPVSIRKTANKHYDTTINNSWDWDSNTQRKHTPQ